MSEKSRNGNPPHTTNQALDARRAVLADVNALCQQLLWSPYGDPARAYLRDVRGFTDAEILDLKLGLFPENLYHLELRLARHRGTGGLPLALCDLMAGYINIPWFDELGRPLTQYGRWPGPPPDDKPKTMALWNPVLGAEEIEHTKRSPLHLDRALRAGHKDVVVVEGVLDASMAQVRGDTRVIAHVAAQFSGDQIETLKRVGIKSVVLVPDPDEGGESGTRSSLTRLAGTGIVGYVAAEVLPDGLDPDEFINTRGIDAWRDFTANKVTGEEWLASHPEKPKKAKPTANGTSPKQPAGNRQDRQKAAGAVDPDNPLLKRILERLDNVRKAGGHFTADCPLHKSKSKASLHVRVSKKTGNILLKCWACGTDKTPAIMKAIGLTCADLFADKNRRDKQPDVFDEVAKDWLAATRQEEADAYAKQNTHATPPGEQQGYSLSGVDHVAALSYAEFQRWALAEKMQAALEEADRIKRGGKRELRNRFGSTDCCDRFYFRGEQENRSGDIECKRCGGRCRAYNLCEGCWHTLLNEIYVGWRETLLLFHAGDVTMKTVLAEDYRPEDFHAVHNADPTSSPWPRQMDWPQVSLTVYRVHQEPGKDPVVWATVFTSSHLPGEVRMTAQEAWEAPLGTPCRVSSRASMDLLDDCLREGRKGQGRGDSVATFWRGAKCIEVETGKPIHFVMPCGMPFEEELKFLKWIGARYEEEGEPYAAIKGHNPLGLDAGALPVKDRIPCPGLISKGRYDLPKVMTRAEFWSLFREAEARYRSTGSSVPVPDPAHPLGPDFDAYHAAARAGPDP
jgi:hypothetical protein